MRDLSRDALGELGRIVVGDGDVRRKLPFEEGGSCGGGHTLEMNSHGEREPLRC